MVEPLRNRQELPKQCCSHESCGQSTGLCRQHNLSLLMGHPTTSVKDIGKLCAARTAPQAVLNSKKAIVTDGLAL